MFHWNSNPKDWKILKKSESLRKENDSLPASLPGCLILTNEFSA